MPGAYSCDANGHETLPAAGCSLPACPWRVILDELMTTHRKRPRDPAQLAKFIVDVATGEVEDRAPTPEEQGKDPAAVALGRKGGAARAATMGAKKRSEIARKAAQKRWKK